MERTELIQILRATGCAEQHGRYIFLRDPHWSAMQRERAAACFAAAASWADAARRRSRNDCSDGPALMERGWLCIPTGGSSGGLKFARHDELTLGAAVRGFCAHFGVQRVNAVDVLPPWHVSGLLARLRCAATGGRHLPWEWRRLAAGSLVPLDAAHACVGGGAASAAAASLWFLSLVPTQLQRLLTQGEAACEWLRGFRAILLGGGPMWPSLAEAAAVAQLPITLSYGMTETAAMVAAQRLGDFARGDRSSGVALPHAQLELDAGGVLRVCGESVMRGYFAAAAHSAAEETAADATRFFQTADLARIDEAGHLHILGRRDEVAISGGEKVRLSEVEATLRATPFFEDVVVLALPDAKWGEALLACYLSATAAPLGEARLREICAPLARHQRPKHWLRFASGEWPRNEQGKLNRAALHAAALARLGI